MKKFFASISVLVYFAMTCGVIVNLHYCMGRIQSVDLYGSEKKVCDKCGMPIDKAHGCCKDEVKIFKLHNDQNKSQVAFSIKNFDAVVNVPSEFIIASTYRIENLSELNGHSPPLLTGQDTYLQNCVFRI